MTSYPMCTTTLPTRTSYSVKQPNLFPTTKKRLTWTQTSRNRGTTLATLSASWKNMMKLSTRFRKQFRLITITGLLCTTWAMRTIWKGSWRSQLIVIRWRWSWILIRLSAISTLLLLWVTMETKTLLRNISWLPWNIILRMQTVCMSWVGCSREEVKWTSRKRSNTSEKRLISIPSTRKLKLLFSKSKN